MKMFCHRCGESAAIVSAALTADGKKTTVIGCGNCHRVAIELYGDITVIPTEVAVEPEEPAALAFPAEAISLYDDRTVSFWEEVYLDNLERLSGDPKGSEFAKAVANTAAKAHDEFIKGASQ